MIHRITITTLALLLSAATMAQEADSTSNPGTAPTGIGTATGGREAFLEEKVKALEAALEQSRKREESTARLLEETEDRLSNALANPQTSTATETAVPASTPETREPSPRQEERKERKSEIHTLSGPKHHHSGGFGAVTFKASEYLDDPLVMMGLRGGWIINRSFAIGIEGHGIIPTTNIPNIIPNEQVVLLGGYGGFFVEPIFLSNQVIHVTLPISAGAGWLGYEQSFETINRLPFNQLIDEDVFWYVEPGANVEINIAKSFRLNLGVSRRLFQDLDLTGAQEDDFSRLNYFFGMKFGSF